MHADRRQRAFVCFTVAAGCFGLLLWARLLLVTGYPRTATADDTQVFQPMHPPTAILERVAATRSGPPPANTQKSPQETPALPTDTQSPANPAQPPEQPSSRPGEQPAEVPPLRR